MAVVKKQQVVVHTLDAMVHFRIRGARCYLGEDVKNDNLTGMAGVEAGVTGNAGTVCF